MTEELTHIDDFIKGYPPFENLSKQQRATLSRQFEVIYFQAGSVLAREPGLTIIRRGAAEVFSSEGILLDKYHEGGCFHYPSLKKELGNVSIEFSEDSLIYVQPESEFTELRKSNRQFDRFFHPSKSKRLRRATKSTDNAHSALQPVSTLMSTKIVSVTIDTSIRDAAKKMSQQKVSSILVLDKSRLAGIVTDRDLRNRAIAGDLDCNKAIAAIMTAEPLTLRPDHSVLDATLIMTQAQVHHLPVTRDEQLVGMLTTSDLMLGKQNDPIYLVQHIRRQRDADGIAKIACRLPDLFSNWVSSGIKGHHLSEVLTCISDAVCQKLIALSIEQLGPAPVPFAWLGFGSQARKEQLLNADQDNGLIISDDATEEDLKWFERLAKNVCDGLNTCGYVYCPGDIMATNPKWRLTFKRWQRTVNHWVTSPTPKATMFVSIFFDVRCIYGDKNLCFALQRHMLNRAKENSIFLASIAKNVLDTPPPLGIFRRFLLERSGQNKHELNVKKSGILPIIECVRLHAIAHNISTVNSFDRIKDLSKCGVLHLSDARNLEDALRFIMRLRCEYQAEQILSGEKPGNFIQPDHISAVSQKQLKDAFDVIADNHQAIKQRYRAGLE